MAGRFPGARRLGMYTAFVLCGKYRDRAVVQALDLAERPQVIAEDLAQLTTSPVLAPLLGD